MVPVGVVPAYTATVSVSATEALTCTSMRSMRPDVPGTKVWKSDNPAGAAVKLIVKLLVAGRLVWSGTNGRADVVVVVVVCVNVVVVVRAPAFANDPAATMRY